jgi:hypothetical protein
MCVCVCMCDYVQWQSARVCVLQRASRVEVLNNGVLSQCCRWPSCLAQRLVLASLTNCCATVLCCAALCRVMLCTG